MTHLELPLILDGDVPSHPTLPSQSLSLSLIAYDCASSRQNVSTIDLSEIGKCNLPMPKFKSEKIPKLQLLEIADQRRMHVIQCKVEVIRTIQFCTKWFGNLAVAKNGLQNYIAEVSRRECEEMHSDRFYQYNNSKDKLRNLQINGTVSDFVEFAGTIKNGDCTGERLKDPYGEWENVVSQGTVKVTLREYYPYVNLETNTITLKSGTVCDYNKFQCMDQLDGYTYWSAIKEQPCYVNAYELLYSGPAT